MTEQSDHPEYTEDESEMLAALRELEPIDAVRDLPPADLWLSIERAVAAAAGTGPSGPELSGLEPSETRSSRIDTQKADLAEPFGRPQLTGTATTAGVSRRRIALWLSAAAIVVVGLVAGAVVIAARGRSETIVAEAKLSSVGLTGAPAGLRGDAEVLKSRQGEVIRVDIGDLRPATGEFLEVWLIKPDISGMVSLGTVRADGTYDFPAGLRIADYPIVDVSTEPYDGNPAHSGASLLRGVLKT